MYYHGIVLVECTDMIPKFYLNPSGARDFSAISSLSFSTHGPFRSTENGDRPVSVTLKGRRWGDMDF